MKGWAVLVAALVLAGAAESEGAEVRSSSTEIAGVIARATVESPTFRALIETIKGTDGIVYVEEGRCRSGARACLRAVTKAGEYRMLWISVDTRKFEWDLMGSIAHELRHAIEVLDNGEVTSTTSMYLFYQRVAMVMPSGFETEAAIRTGNQVRREVRKK
jgi:hypothetical protein